MYILFAVGSNKQGVFEVDFTGKLCENVILSFKYWNIVQILFENGSHSLQSSDVTIQVGSSYS